MSRVLLIAGTHSWDGDGRVDWYAPGSPFVRFLIGNGVYPIFGEDVSDYAGVRLRPYTWSTRLGGVGFGDGDLAGWRAAGVNLFHYLVPPLCPEKRVRPVDTNLIVHSHGLQPALFACAEGLKVNTLISVGSPVRKDTEAIARAARKNITRWLHLHSDSSDWWQVFGGFFDGKLGIVRAQPHADDNQKVPKVGHSELLRNPDHFPMWEQRGWLTWLQPVAAV